MSGLLVIPLFVVLALVAVLVWPVRLTVCVDIDMPRGAEGELEICFLGGIVRLEYGLECNVLEPSRFLLLNKKGKEPRVLLRLGQKKQAKRVAFPVKQILPHVRVRRLRVSGEVGLRQDAFYTAMLTGVLSLLCQHIWLLFINGKKRYEENCICIRPAFNESCLRLNLEGIVLCAPIHIIIAIIFYGSKNRKGQKTAWRILSKTS